MILAIQRYFEIALYLLVLTGFATLASTQGLDAGSILFVAAALLVRGVLLATRRVLLLPERWTTTLTLAYVGFYIFDYVVLSQQFVSTTVHLVLFLTVVRLFSARRDRDNYFLVVIAFLMVLAAAVLTVDSVFLLAFSVFMLFAVASFILMEMKRSAGQASAKSPAMDHHPQRLATSLAGAAPVMLLFILVAGTAIFFVLPRISTGYFSVFAPSGKMATGFSDHVDLGSIGEIQQSSAVVMHVEMSGNKQDLDDLRWRGIALSVFDGKSWSNPHRPHVLRPEFGQQFDLRPSQERAAPIRPGELASQLHYHVVMEPVGINVFLLAERPQEVQGKYRLVGMDRDGSVFNLDTEHMIGIYDGWSLANSRQETSASQPSGPEELEDYLQLPALDPRIPALAKKVSADASSEDAKAAAVERYLKSNFGYTLQLPSTRQADPLANFLFERKRGHCEYFASALAVMLRSLKIPSRVVTGFRRGEFNEITSQYVVRGSDAHAWVEAYFPDRGWITLDPTPGGPGLAATPWGRLAMYGDAMASFWREWVVNYDFAHQFTVGRQAARNSRQMVDQVRAWARSCYERILGWARRLAGKASGAPTVWASWALICAGSVLLLVNLPRLWRAIRDMRLAARPEKAPSPAATLWYRKMLRRLDRKGWKKSVTQTPREFAGSIQDEALRAQVAEFTRSYEGARFGNSAEDSRKLPELYAEMAGHVERAGP
jgi:hypothetical protein